MFDTFADLTLASSPAGLSIINMNSRADSSNPWLIIDVKADIPYSF